MCFKEPSGKLRPVGPLPHFLSHDQPLPVSEAVPVARRWGVCSLSCHPALPQGHILTPSHPHTLTSSHPHTFTPHIFLSQLRIGGVAEMMSPTFLNPLLQSALDSSLHGNSPNAELLTFAVSGSPPSHPHGIPTLIPSHPHTLTHSC